MDTVFLLNPFIQKSMIMDVIDITPPIVEPVSLTRAKLFLRVEHDAEDDLIADMIRAARERVETYIGRSLIERQRRIKSNIINRDVIAINHQPIRSVHAVNIVMHDGSKCGSGRGANVSPIKPTQRVGGLGC